MNTKFRYKTQVKATIAKSYKWMVGHTFEVRTIEVFHKNKIITWEEVEGSLSLGTREKLIAFKEVGATQSIIKKRLVKKQKNSN